LINGEGSKVINEFLMSFFALRGHIDLLDGLVGLIHGHRTNQKGLILHQVDFHGKVLGDIPSFEKGLKKAY
jgi:hypothetical protein